MGDLYFSKDAGASFPDASIEAQSAFSDERDASVYGNGASPAESQAANPPQSSYSLADALLDHAGFRKIFRLFGSAIPWW